MICNKCGHRMNKIEDKEDGVVIRIRHKCGNVDCRNEHKIERTVYKDLKSQLAMAQIIKPEIKNNVEFLMLRL